MARMDTRDTRRTIRETYPSGGATYIRSMLPPEESTTLNLVRRLAYWQERRGGQVTAILHSRALEGGLTRRHRPPSGADLELAVEVRPTTWIDLLLQAKRISEPIPGHAARYGEWKPTQIRNLRRWAADNGDRDPGVLLYNAEIPPFGAPPMM